MKIFAIGLDLPHKTLLIVVCQLLPFQVKLLLNGIQVGLATGQWTAYDNGISPLRHQSPIASLDFWFRKCLKTVNQWLVALQLYQMNF